MRTSARLLLSSLFGLSLLTLAGCPGGNEVDVPQPGTYGCESNSECATGEICINEECFPGECDPNLVIDCRQADIPEDIQPYCCGVFQLCSELATCYADPDAPVGSQCVVSDDCTNVGDFCSGGTCYNPAGRRPCTASHQCPAGERCDPTAFLCVPDNGGCTFCEQAPELCCNDAEGEICDQESGFCVDPTGDECTPQTADADCLPNQQCDSLGRCVQCLTDGDCGPGTVCNVATGSCFSEQSGCESDEDCDNGRRCNGLGECTVPQCESDGECSDSREVCDLATFTCYLPPAVCSEVDEDPEAGDNNNSIGNASPLSNGAFSGTICRGDNDYISFPVQAAKRYRVSIGFTGFVYGVSVELLNNSGSVVDSEDPFSTDGIDLVGFTGSDGEGSFYIRINGLTLEEDVEAYTVTVEETDAPDIVTCDQAITDGIEPNENVASATVVSPGAYNNFRCSFEDIDTYRVEVPPLHGISARIEFDDDEGDLELYLLDGVAPNAVIDSDTEGFGETVRTVSYGEVEPAPDEECQVLESCSVFYVQVVSDAFSFFDPLQQLYTMTIEAVERPEDCATDPHEFDGNIDNAYAWTNPTESHDAIACRSNDADFYRFTLPAGQGGAVVLSGFDGHNLKLEIDDDNGMLVGASDTSTAMNHSETVSLPFSASDQEFIARVLFSSTSGQVATYSLLLDSYDAGVCIAGEPVDNNTWEDATCVGTFSSSLPCASNVTSAAPPSLEACRTALGNDQSPAGCYSACGDTDGDYYRVGSLSNGQVLNADLQHNAADGRLDITVFRVNSSFSSIAEVTSVINDGETPEDHLQLTHIFDSETPREVVVRVRPQVGGPGYAAQPYTLDLSVSGGCFDDANDLDDAENDTPASSTGIRPTPAPGAFSTSVTDVTRCGGDIDVYNFLSFPNDAITATLRGAPGMSLELGLGASPLTLPPTIIATGMSVGSPATDAGTPDADAGSMDADAGAMDDAGTMDGGSMNDAGAPDTGTSDAGTSDAGVMPPPAEDPQEEVVLTFTNTDYAYQTLYLVVGGEAAAVGAYTLDVDIAAP